MANDKEGLLNELMGSLSGQMLDPSSQFQQNMQGMVQGQGQGQQAPVDEEQMMQLAEEERRRKLLEEAQRRSAIESAASVAPVTQEQGDVSRWNPFVWMFGHPSDVGKE